MSSSSGQQQFRYTQTPSKVLHLRNLPWECTEEELVELCKPFGKIVNTKCNVGANRNQAFIEFDLRTKKMIGSGGIKEMGCINWFYLVYQRSKEMPMVLHNSSLNQSAFVHVVSAHITTDPV